MRHLLVFSLWGAALPALAQQNPAPNPDAVAPQPWYRPHHLVLQTAGGMGMVAAGTGYSFWRDRAESDVLLGYVPKKHAGSALTIATVKFLYTPFRVPVSPKFELRPLTLGLYVSYTHGTINDEEKGQYTKGYYWFSTDTRVGALLGGRLSYLQPDGPTGRQRRISAYYELGTNDMYLYSFVPNGNYRSLSVTDILTLGLGVKAEF